MSPRYLFIIAGVALGSVMGHAQLNTQGERSFLDDFLNEAQAEFDNFRRNSMMEFADFLANPWKEFEQQAPIPAPQPPAPPMPVPEVEPYDGEAPVEDTPVVVNDTVITPAPAPPQPQPVEPIREVPVVQPATLVFTFFGTPESVRLDAFKLPHLASANEPAIAKHLKSLCEVPDVANLAIDCLRIRKNRSLSDWAYLQMLQSLAREAYQGEGNDATLLTAYLYLLSGYKMRLALDAGRVYLLYASQHVIYDLPSYLVDNDHFYPLGNAPVRIKIGQTAYPGETPMSLIIATAQKLNHDESTPRQITSRLYPDVKASVSVNKNLLQFYDSYPTSYYDGNIMTRWAQYANTPLDSTVTASLYPDLRASLTAKTQLGNVSRLLNWVQTGLKYEYDDKVWGGDRAFFAEESLYYPYCDCEDRSILLTRLVRDLLGLRCILVYYPGHLACAVEFTDDSAHGDVIRVDNRRFVVCDPTYINAPVGRTMPGMDNTTAQAILLPL